MFILAPFYGSELGFGISSVYLAGLNEEGV